MKVCEMAEGLTDQAREADAARAWVATAEVAVSADLECSEKTNYNYIYYVQTLKNRKQRQYPLE